MFGFTMIESTGMSGRLPVLSVQVKDAQFAAAVDPENMAGRGRRVGVESAHGGVADRHVRGGHGRIEGDPEDRPVRQDRVAAGDVHPIRLARVAGAEIEPIQTLPSFVPTMATL